MFHAFSDAAAKLLMPILVAVLSLQVADVRGAQYPFASDAWEIVGQEIERVEYLGKAAVRMKDARAALTGVEFRDGIIEYDIAVSRERGFAGVRFRMQDDDNFENFYIRPHQSGNPDANQYTPVFNGNTGWQLYYGDGYAVPVVYRFNEWMHIKIAFRDSLAEVYIDSDAPVLYVSDLKRAVEAGQVGLDASRFSDVYFADFEVSALPANYRFAAAKAQPDTEPETVPAWQVSETFDGTLIQDRNTLTAEFIREKAWAVLRAEPTGISNLGSIRRLAPDNDTVIARLVVESDKAQLKGLTFGYSDTVSVYMNGTRLYSGSNLYGSRDYRYLGTIGLFDEVYLPLRPGRNEVWFAVSEGFGGWGIQARFDDVQGIRLVDEP